MSTTQFTIGSYADYMKMALDLNKPLTVMKELTRELSFIQSVLIAASDNKTATYQDLIDAPMTLDAKDEVMRAMRIVPVPLCAIYLGIPTEKIHDFKRKFGECFGADYCQSLCFSINELKIFAKNRHWFETPSEYCGPVDRATPPTWFLLQGTFVGSDVMMGYLAVNNAASRIGIPQNGSVRRPFRLSDIRSEFMTRFPAPLSSWPIKGFGVKPLLFEARKDVSGDCN